MSLIKEQRIEIILMAELGSSCMVALNFNRKHGMNITRDTVAKRIRKLGMLQINREVVQDLWPPMKT